MYTLKSGLEGRRKRARYRDTWYLILLSYSAYAAQLMSPEVMEHRGRIRPISWPHNHFTARYMGSRITW